MRYTVSIIGLPLGTAEAKASVDASHYSIEAEAKLTGLAALVSRSKGAAEASGEILQGRVAPSAYATTSANDEMTRTVRMAMKAGSVEAVDVTPPFEDLPGRVPVTEADKRHILDPLSALIMTVPGDEPLVGPAACDRTIPVYDGYARFNIKLTYVGSRKTKIRGYDGPVSVCAARYVPIAGHRPNRPATKFMIENKHLEVWLAPFSAARVELPLRISVGTMIGTTVVQAIEMRQNGLPAGPSPAPTKRVDSSPLRSPSDRSGSEGLETFRMRGNIQP